MRGWLVLLAAITGAQAAHAAAPDLRACPLQQHTDMSERQRKKPLPVPGALSALVRSDMNNYAVLTLSGGTVCVDTRFVEDTQGDLALSPDKRFLSFTWEGYESGGYMLVDRSGKGQVVETGAPPTFSPSGKRLAAVEWSESGFGSLNGFAVWHVEPEGLKQLALLEDIPGMASWKIDRWSGEDCVELSGVPTDKVPDDPREIDSAPHTHFAARPAGATWKLAPSPRGCAAH